MDYFTGMINKFKILHTYNLDRYQQTNIFLYTQFANINTFVIQLPANKYHNMLPLDLHVHYKVLKQCTHIAHSTL